MGTAERKIREKSQRRENIVLAAEHLFFTKGFGAATMDDIATEAELSKGTLYLYFKSKEDIHVAVAFKAIQMLNDMVLEIKKMKTDGIEKLVKLGWTFIEFSRKYPDHINSILYLEGLDLQNISLTMNELRRIIYEESPVSLVREFVEQGIEERSIRNDIPAVIIANTLWMQMLGVVQLIALKKSLFEMAGLTPESLYENHIKLLINGIKS